MRLSSLRFFFVGVVVLASGLAQAQAFTSTPTPPALMLADSWHPSRPWPFPATPLTSYWVSEKYDGVRGYWDGRQLWTRNGRRIAAPAGFTEDWPTVPMDGELWAGRGRFELASAIVRNQTPKEADWQPMRFMAFDLPTHPGDFNARLKALQQLLSNASARNIQAVPQQRATTPKALRQQLDDVVKAGGEGLMLHLGNAPYRGIRSGDLLKIKPWDDAEAIVIAHLRGNGKNANRMGSLLVRTLPDAQVAEGLELRLGSGFTDAQRENPPAIGSTVTYRYNGLSAKGVPRFARFLRVREDE